MNPFIANNLAAKAFFQALRREWTTKNIMSLTAGECPIPPWDQMEPDAKRRFAKCMGFALAAASPTNLHRDTSQD